MIVYNILKVLKCQYNGVLFKKCDINELLMAKSVDAADIEVIMREQESRFVDNLGILLEGMGESRMAGRIFAALMLAESSETSSSELARTLGISSGSVSMATRGLVARGLIERVGVPGERKIYFRVNPDANGVAEFIIEAGKQMRKIQELLDWGEELVKEKDPSVLKRFEGMREVFEFFRNELDSMMARWEEHRRKGG
jgi:DNA-binding transcriptional regulator GbsR (MarR family)